MKKLEVYKLLGVKLRNDQNSWSGISDIDNRAYLTVWPDHFKEDGTYVFWFDKPLLTANGRVPAGRKGLITDIEHALATNNGVIGTVICHPKNPTQLRRQTVSAERGPDMRIARFDRATGFYIAEVIQPETEGAYKVTWFRMGDDGELASARANTLAEARALISQRPDGWKRYLIEHCRFVERGDAFGPRGMPAEEHDHGTFTNRQRIDRDRGRCHR
jgi:hypothetical protein